VGGVRVGLGCPRGGRWERVCARAARSAARYPTGRPSSISVWPALLRGPSTSPLGAGVKRLRNVLLATIMGALGAIVLGWAVFLSDICKSPATPVPATHNTVAFSCHGALVFIKPLQEAAIHWGWLPLFCLILVANLLRKWQPK
jgi:hypothetical protein